MERITVMGNEVWRKGQAVPKRNRRGEYASKGFINNIKLAVRRKVRNTVRWIKWALWWVFIRCVIGAAAFAALGGAFLVGKYNTKVVEYTATKADAATINVVAAPQKDAIPAPLRKIINAESQGYHYRKGQLTYNINLNGKTCKECTLDMGVAQINVETWGAQATKLGYDLTKAEDNIKMAEWIYDNYGTAPWTSSKKSATRPNGWQ